MTERYRLFVLGAVVALCALVAASIVGVAIAGHASDSTPLIVALLGFVAPTVAALMALLVVQRVEKATNHLQHEVDRRLHNVEEQVNEVANG